MSQPIREFDPAELCLPPSRTGGADPWKLHQQVRLFGSSKVGMPAIFVYEDPDGILEIFDGVTRATRLAKLAPGRDGSGCGDRLVSPQSVRFPARQGPFMSESDTRAELFAALRELSEIVSEMRAGQLVAAVGELCGDLHGRGLWDATDAELLEAVWQFRRTVEAATAAPSRQHV